MTLDEEKERLQRMEDAWRDSQNGIKDRLGSPAALQRAIGGGWNSRVQAIQMLGYLDRDDEALQLALAENEAEAVTDHALRLLLPTPAELVMHALTMKKGIAGGKLRFSLSFANVLHAEPAIVACFAKSAAKLPVTTIEGFGFAALKSAAPMVARHARVDRLLTHARALAAGHGAKAKPSVPRDPAQQWDGPSERAIAALEALRRLDADVDIALVERLRAQCLVALDPSKTRHGVHDWARLTWVLFDAGVDTCFDELMTRDERYNVNADIGTTLLKRGDMPRLRQWLASLNRAYPPTASNFCHWPVLDTLHAEGFFDFPDQQLPEMYALSRHAGVGPPPWWTWRTPWSLSCHYRKIRGRL